MRIAICDDNADFADNLRELIGKKLGITGAETSIDTYHGGADFPADSSGYDAVFLDIDMPAVNGFEIAEKINRVGETLIVFVTMHDELVYSSIKFRPFRFIRKSHLAGELPEVLDALERAVRKRFAGQKFEFQTKTGTVFLDVGSIEYIEIYGHWLFVCVDGGGELECYGSLSQLEELLTPFDFIRTHKSYLVNCKYIYAIEKGQVILDDKTKIPLSRYRAEEIREKFRNYIRSGI